MKNNKQVILLVVAFVILIGGGSAAYRVLAGFYDAQAEIRSEEPGGESIDNHEEAGTAAETALPAELPAAPAADLAPDITVYDQEGNEVHLSDYRNKKPVVVNFWASWCPPCKEEMPYFQNAADRYGDEVEILMVNLTDGSRETKDKANAFIAQNGYQMKVLFDTEMDATYTYRLYSIPQTMFIDREGRMIYEHVGMISQNKLDSNIEALISDSTS